MGPNELSGRFSLERLTSPWNIDISPLGTGPEDKPERYHFFSRLSLFCKPFILGRMDDAFLLLCGWISLGRVCTLPAPWHTLILQSVTLITPEMSQWTVLITNTMVQFFQTCGIVTSCLSVSLGLTRNANPPSLPQTCRMWVLTSHPGDSETCHSLRTTAFVLISSL